MEALRDQHEGKSRFLHLLQPIRDLAANWAIDIAAELAEYLEELEAITFSFDGGQSTLNFAEAALVIQGSACIYSKKVESLHILVYQALDIITKKKRAEQAGADLEAGGNSNQDDEEEEEARFLLLDDIPEGTGIDLDEGAADEHPSSIATARRPPAAFLAIEDERIGDGTGSKMGTEVAAYKINSCSVHRSGALLLDPRDGDTLDEHLQPITARPNPTHSQPSGWSPGQAPEPSAPNQGNDQMENDDNNFGGGGGDWDLPSEDPNQQSEETQNGAAPGTSWGGSWNEQTRGGAEVKATALEGGALEEEEVDPWKPLDPHDPGIAVLRPYKRGRPVRRPRQKRAASASANLAYPLAPSRGVFFLEFAPALQALLRAKRAARRAEKAVKSKASGSNLGGANGWQDGQDDDDFPANDGGEDYEPDAIEMGDGEDRPFFFGADGATAGAVEEAKRTYEDLVRDHIESMLKKAAEAEVQTDLAGRVAVWRQKIEPLLEEQNARPEFDIHLYGARVLDVAVAADCARLEDNGGSTLTSADEAVPFTEVVKGHQAHEVSRLFAAMLQLINNGNVAVANEGACDVFDASHPFRLKVLSLHKPHEDMLNYRAPSMLPGAPSPSLQVAESSPGRAVGVKKKAPRKKQTKLRLQDERLSTAVVQEEEAIGLADTQEETLESIKLARRSNRANPPKGVGTEESSLESAVSQGQEAAEEARGPSESWRPTPASEEAAYDGDFLSQQSGLATQQSVLAEAVPTQRSKPLSVSIRKGSGGHFPQASLRQALQLASTESSKMLGAKRVQRSPLSQVAPKVNSSQVSGMTQVSGLQGLGALDESNQSVIATPNKGLGSRERGRSLALHELSPSAEVENAVCQGLNQLPKGTPDGKRRKKSIRPQRPPFRPV